MGGRSSRGGGLLDRLLDHLGVQKLEELPPKEQIKLLRHRYARIIWDHVNAGLKRYLVFRLAEEAGVVHPRFLTSDHFKSFEIEELGSTLIGLHDNYAEVLVKCEKLLNAQEEKPAIGKFDPIYPLRQKITCLHL